MTVLFDFTTYSFFVPQTQRDVSILKYCLSLSLTLIQGWKNSFIKSSVYLQNLKRTATILFTALYLLASTGVLVGQHLCMDRVKETKLFKKAESNCGMSMAMHQDMEEGCCDDEWALKILEDEQQMSFGSNAPIAVYHLLYETSFNELLFSITLEDDQVEMINTGPPDINEPDLFILHSSLKIPTALQS